MRTILFTFAAMVSQMTVLTSTAFAFYDDDMTIARIRQERRSSMIQFNGALNCNMGTQNTGSACKLTFQDIESGKTFNLTQTTEAMKLYASGTKKVSIEGTFADSETIAVAKVSAL